MFQRFIKVPTGRELEASSYWYDPPQDPGFVSHGQILEPVAPSVNKSQQGETRDKAQNEMKREGKRKMYEEG